MKIIEPSVEIIKEPNPFKQIERIGRTCYKSEDKITDTSCYKFVQGLIDRKHFAMLEHGRVIFEVTGDVSLQELMAIMRFPDSDILLESLHLDTCGACIALSLSHLYNPRYSNSEIVSQMRELLRNFISQRYVVPLELIPQVSEDYFGKRKHHDPSTYYLLGNRNFIIDFSKINDTIKSISAKFTCDRGVSHELVRHRVSVAQESTRYCNYCKEKFGGQVTFVFPSSYDSWSDRKKELFIKSCEQSEENYMNLLENGCTPQEARAVLTNALKTECILTMKAYQWTHFFDMRLRGTTGQPHPDMQECAKMAHDAIIQEFGINL